MGYEEDFSTEDAPEEFNLEKNINPEKFDKSYGHMAGMGNDEMEKREAEAKRLLKKDITEAGYPVCAESKYCGVWRAKHKTCEGCDFHGGCKRFKIMIDVTKEIGYNLSLAPQHIALFMKLMNDCKKLVIENGEKPDMTEEWKRIVKENS